MTGPSAAERSTSERPTSERPTSGRPTSGRRGEPAGPGATPSVCVVVPYYKDQAGLDRLLTALELQTIGHARLEVVVADDGSPTQPMIGRRPFPVRVVRQEERGFRAAAARNLGAAAASAPVVAFVDGDMVPEPDYLAQLVRAVDERTLCVARRRHADLAGWGPDRLRAWLAGAAPGPSVLDEPAWLRDGYAATADLTRADDTSYRFVISAVLVAPRAMLRRLGASRRSSPATAGRTGTWPTGGGTPVVPCGTCPAQSPGMTDPTSPAETTSCDAAPSRTSRRCGWRDA